MYVICDHTSHKPEVLKSRLKTQAAWVWIDPGLLRMCAWVGESWPSAPTMVPMVPLT